MYVCGRFIQRVKCISCIDCHLLQVRSTHPYAGEDIDELSFDKGEIIDVIPFDDEDDEVCALQLLCGASI